MAGDVQRERIYLDNAATSWPKPDAVYAAADEAMRVFGAPAGRSQYAEATEVARRIEHCRRRAARLVGLGDAKRVIFTSNGTDSLNLALHGLLAGGGHVVTTTTEHNSVLRPLHWLQEHCGVTVTHVACRDGGRVAVDDVAAAIKPETNLVAVNHASNVTGLVQPIAEIGALARQRGVLTLVDAAQSLGHAPLDMQTMQIDLLAAPGHKGLLGPLGVGLLFVGRGVEDRLDSIRQGGTGTRSDEPRQPAGLPDKYESGNLNVPGILGLAAGLEYLEAKTIAAVQRHIDALTNEFIAAAAAVPGVQVHAAGAGPRVGVVSLSLAGYDPQEVAAMLDSGFGVQVRAGLHCAPLMHRELGTLPRGGTVRFSFGPFNTSRHVRAAVAALSEIASAALPS